MTSMEDEFKQTSIRRCVFGSERQEWGSGMLQQHVFSSLIGAVNYRPEKTNPIDLFSDAKKAVAVSSCCLVDSFHGFGATKQPIFSAPNTRELADHPSRKQKAPLGGYLQDQFPQDLTGAVVQHGEGTTPPTKHEKKQLNLDRQNGCFCPSTLPQKPATVTGKKQQLGCPGKPRRNRLIGKVGF